MTYADKDPEDAYDATDPVRDRVDVLERVVEALEADLDDPRMEARRRDALRLVANLAAEDLTRKQARHVRHVRDALEAL